MAYGCSNDGLVWMINERINESMHHMMEAWKHSNQIEAPMTTVGQVI